MADTNDTRTDEFRREVEHRFARHSNGAFPGSPGQAIDTAVEVYAEMAPSRLPVADTEWGVGNPIFCYASEEEARAVYGRCVSTGQRVRLVRRTVGEWTEVESTHD